MELALIGSDIYHPSFQEVVRRMEGEKYSYGNRVLLTLRGLVKKRVEC